MAEPEEATEPEPWDVVHYHRRARERLDRAARDTVDRVLGRIGLPRSGEIANAARDTADGVLERVGLPSTAEIEDAVADVVHTVRIPEAFRPRLPDPGEVAQGLREGAQWIEDQLGALRDRLDSPPDEGTEPAEGEDGWGVIEWALFALLLDWLSRQELSHEIDLDHALWTFDEQDDGVFEQWSKTVFTPEAGFAARVGDVMIHGDAIAPGLGSPNVLIGGRPALRVCDSHVCTKTTPLPHAGSGFTATYDKVEINGFAALRVGDYLDEGSHGLNAIVMGSPSVVIGPKPKPVECWQPGEEAPMRRPDLHPFRWRKGQVGHFKGKVVLGADLSGAFVRVEGTVTGARLWAEESRTFERPLGDIDGDGKVEAWRVSTRGKSERALGVSDVELEARWPRKNPITKKKITPKPKVAKSDLKVDHELVELP